MKQSARAEQFMICWAAASNKALFAINKNYESSKVSATSYK